MKLTRPSLQHSVFERVRAARMAAEAEQMRLLQAGDTEGAEAVAHDHLGSLIESMGALLSVASEGEKVSFEPLSETHFDQPQRYPYRSFNETRRQNFVSAINSDEQGNQYRGCNNIGRNDYCKRCGCPGHYGSQCQKYQRFARYFCRFCQQNGINLYYYESDCTEGPNEQNYWDEENDTNNFEEEETDQNVNTVEYQGNQEADYDEDSYEEL